MSAVAEAKKVRRVRVEPDEDSRSPREEAENNFGTMYCWHRRYNLGDVQPSYAPRDLWIHVMKTNWPSVADEDISHARAAKYKEANLLVLPLYLYDHSGITMACTPFQCPFDSGQVGEIVVARSKAREWFQIRKGKQDVVDARARELMLSEVAVYDHYLQNEVYGYVIEEADPESDLKDKDSWEEVESCWGFYGPDWRTNGIKASLSEADQALVVEL